MSYEPIIEGSAASPGLWNRRFQSIWSSLDTLSASSGTDVLYSSVTAVRGASSWAVEAPVSVPILSMPVSGAISVLRFGSVASGGFDVYASGGSQPLLQFSPSNGLTGRFLFQGTGGSDFSGDGSLSMNSNLWIGSTPSKVVGARATGWSTVPTGTPIRTTFVTSSATLGDLAQRLAALIIDLTAHGLIGP